VLKVYALCGGYTKENMDRDVLPTAVWDEREMARSPGSATCGTRAGSR